MVCSTPKQLPCHHFSEETRPICESMFLDFIGNCDQELLLERACLGFGMKNARREKLELPKASMVGESMDSVVCQDGLWFGSQGPSFDALLFARITMWKVPMFRAARQLPIPEQQMQCTIPHSSSLFQCMWKVHCT